MPQKIQQINGTVENSPSAHNKGGKRKGPAQKIRWDLSCHQLGSQEKEARKSKKLLLGRSYHEKRS